MTIENQTTVLETLVGEGKKFKTQEDLAKGKVEADAFIVTLQNQIKEIAEELSKANVSAERKTTLENLMSSLTNTTKQPVETKTGNQPQEPSNQSGTSLSHDDVVKIVEAREREAVKARNLANALAPVRKLYGEKTDEVLAAKAASLGLTVETLQNLAAQSPAAFLNIVGVNARDNSTRPMATHSSVNVAGGNDGDDSSVHNKAYYDNLRSQMGALKFVNDSKLQLQRHKDMMALGDAWDE
jgi:hypothetical protein